MRRVQKAPGVLPNVGSGNKGGCRRNQSSPAGRRFAFRLRTADRLFIALILASKAQNSDSGAARIVKGFSEGKRSQTAHSASKMTSWSGASSLAPWL